MAIQNKNTLCGYFNTGDTPTESNFADLVDSGGVAQDKAKKWIRVQEETGVAGNTRGSCAVDLQTQRGSAGRVAAGNASAVISGEDNAATKNYGVVVGGDDNCNTGAYAVIGGGRTNLITSTGSGDCASIVGGSQNTLTDSKGSTIANGYGNLADLGESNFIAGCCNSMCYGSFSAIIGGELNKINADCNVDGCGWLSAGASSILGGESNRIGGCASACTPARYSSIIGGCGGLICGSEYSSIIGGKGHTISGSHNNTVIIGGANLSSPTNNAVIVSCLHIPVIPTASTGLCNGAVWNDAGTLKIVT